MNNRILIYGCGSIGNHLAYASRCNDLSVTMTDVSDEALKRTKNDIYPSRYSKWDESIKLAAFNQVQSKSFDGVIIGTPPDTHMGIAIEAIKLHSPKCILIEKPLCTPSLSGLYDLLELANCHDVKVLVGYNHVLTNHTKFITEQLMSGVLSNPIYMTTYTKEHWSGIFNAHPWLSGPKDSYLGYWERGGGALGEHSHALNIWQYFSHVMNKGRISEVTAFMDFINDGEVNYDQLAHLCVKTDTGFMGAVTQDVITNPAIKRTTIQDAESSIHWTVNKDQFNDSVEISGQEHLFKKTRPDDFFNEIVHFKNIISGDELIEDSPISITRGVETMLVIEAAYRSFIEKKTINVDYEKLDQYMNMCSPVSVEA